MRYVIYGCGYTGERVAQRLLERGADLTVTTREPPRLAHLAERGATVVTEAPCDGARVLYSIPPPTVVETAGAERVVYISSTGVYGATTEVDETTPVAPATEMGRARLQAERDVDADLVLRSSAIYGPGRGVHDRFLQCKTILLDNSTNFVSRIHVDDLATHCLAALDSDVTGAFPVADDRPAPTLEVIRHVRAIHGIGRHPREVDPPEMRRFTRRVDGRAIRRLLGIELRYPTYVEGLDASWIPGVVIRPVMPGDRAALSAAFAQLSDESRFLRFHGAKHELSEAELDYFTRLDGRDRIAYAAFDEDGNGMGGAGLVRVGGHVAEFAVTILDAHQGKGLGTLLARRLIVAAKEQSITRLRAEVLPRNERMHRLMQHIAPGAEPGKDGAYEFELTADS